MADRLTRRVLLKGLLAGTAVGAGGSAFLRRPEAAAAGDPTKFLVCIGGFGGASIIDSFMPLAEADVTPSEAAVANVYPDSEVVTYADTDLRAVDRDNSLFAQTYPSRISAFLDAHRHHTTVATHTVTSVNHAVGQKRSITGNGAWNGRTLQEAVAIQYGESRPLPNVTMGSLGFREDGDDDTVPAFARAEPVAAPLRWPLGLDSMHGIENVPDREIVELARELRNSSLDEESSFAITFQLSERLKRWRAQREEQQPQIEAAELMKKLNFGLEYGSLPQFDPDDLSALESVFGRLTIDPLESQAAMAYLLIKHGISVAVTISPNWNLITNPNSEEEDENLVFNPPLSFDYSHTRHRDAQGIMWQRILDQAHALITLLQGAEHPECPGESLWEHTLVYVPTEFGRSRQRQDFDVDFPSMHHLNNGAAMFSTLTAPGTVLGGVHPDGMTYGYDPSDGTPRPSEEMPEDVVYAGVLAALGIDTAGAGLPAVPAMLA